jgi:hypothetical protein
MAPKVKDQVPVDPDQDEEVQDGQSGKPQSEKSKPVEKKEPVLSDREIREREKDLGDALATYSAARDKVRAATSMLKESAALYQDFLNKCNRSASNKYGMVSQRLRALATLTLVAGICNRLTGVVRDTSRIQTLVAGDVRRAVMDPELLK